MATTTFTAFLIALRLAESGGDYQVVNTLNFLGAYQFGEAALIDLGYVRRDQDLYDNDFSGGWTGKNGIYSIQDFLENEGEQDRAAENWMHLMWSYIEAQEIDDFAWKQVGETELTTSGMLAATHLLGTGALREYIDSNGQIDPKDPYGMPLSQYIAKLGGYEIPFAPADT